MLKLHSFGATDIGRKRRQNEDAFFISDHLGLFVVADGLGGHASGEIASHEAIDVIHAWVQREEAIVTELAQNPEDADCCAAARRMLERAVMAATYHVFSMAQYDQRNSGMGTTISALIIAGTVGVTAQVGDSRIYRLRDGGVTQLTDDHTLVAMQVRDGLLTAEEARVVPHRNVITRAVGSHEYVQVDTASIAVEPGDQYLLCTDGLHGYLTNPDIVSLLATPPENAATQLIGLANERGGKDNITAVVVRIAG